jgi:hypothetical protein
VRGLREDADHDLGVAERTGVPGLRALLPLRAGAPRLEVGGLLVAELRELLDPLPEGTRGGELLRLRLEPRDAGRDVENS